MSAPSNGLDTVDRAEQLSGMNSLQRFSQGKSQAPTLAAGRDAPLFEGLKGELETLLDTATPVNRAELHFKLALHRSLRYSMCGSIHILRMGQANSFRSVYEYQRLLSPINP